MRTLVCSPPKQLALSPLVNGTDANGTNHKPHKRGDGLTVMKVGGMPLAVPNVVAGRA